MLRDTKRDSKLASVYSVSFQRCVLSTAAVPHAVLNYSTRCQLASIPT